MSAATALTRRRAKAGRPAEPTSAPTAAFPATREQEIAWLECLENVLDHAANTDEAPSPDSSGESDRLLRVASELAGRLLAHPSDAGDCSTVDNRAYTIASLIKAALQVRGDTPSAERLAFIEQARAPLVGLTNDPTVLDGWETYLRAAPVPAEPAPPAARPRDWLPDVQGKVVEAAAVLGTLAEDGGTDQIWGLVRLAEWLADQGQARLDDTQSAGTPFKDSAADIACVLSMLYLVAEHDDHVLIHAAGSILEIAASYCESAQELGHA